MGDNKNMITKAPLVCFVIVNFNGITDTIECLDSMKNLRYSNFKVILVDNGSAEEEVTKILGHSLTTACIRNRSNEGFAKASNKGITKALDMGADYVFLLNNDTRVTPGSLETLISLLSEHPSIGLVQPKILYSHSPSYVNSSGGRLYLDVGYVRDLGLNKKVSGHEMRQAGRDWISGCAMLIKREVFSKIGLLDEKNFPQGGEDYDFSWRARLSGYKLACSDKSIIYHKVSRTRRTLGASTVTEMVSLMGDPKIQLFRKHSRHFLTAELIYKTIFRPIETVEYLLHTPDSELRYYYISRFVSSLKRKRSRL